MLSVPQELDIDYNIHGRTKCLCSFVNQIFLREGNVKISQQVLLKNGLIAQRVKKKYVRGTLCSSMSQDTKWVEIISKGAPWVYQKMSLTYKRKDKSLGTIHD